MTFSKKSLASRLLCFFSVIGMIIMLIPFSSFSVKAIGDTSLFGEVLVSDTGTMPSIDRINTARKLAVSSDGTIYATYHCAEGVKVAKSTNRGQTFQTSVLAYDKNVDAEIAVSTEGVIYLAFSDSEGFKVIKSTDDGATFSAPVTAVVFPKVEKEENGVDLEEYIPTVHMATDGNYVYLIDQNGTDFYRSTDSGETFKAVHLCDEDYAFSDVHVDPATHKVIVQEDSPIIKYYVSSDYGATFSQPVAPENAVVYFSVGSFGTDSTGSYLLVAGAAFDGGEGLGVKINLATGAATQHDFGKNLVDSGRSLSSDTYGNTVTGYSNGSYVYFMVSHDLAETFSEPVQVAQSKSANAAINTTNGDIMFLYNRAGKIYLKVYGGLLSGYDLSVSNSSLYFNADKKQLKKDVTITNISDETLPISSIAATGDFTIDKSAVGSTLAPGKSAVIHITFKHTKCGTSTGTLSITYGNSSVKRVNLTGYMTKQLPPEQVIEVTETPAEIKNPEVVSVKPVGEAFNQPVEVRLKDDPTVEEAIKGALDGIITEDLKDTVVFPLDISLYIKGTNTKVQPNKGTSVTITCPIPEKLLASKDKIKVVCLIDGKLTVLPTKIVQVDGVWCVQFTATHFSPYALVVDNANVLTLGVNTPKTTPTTPTNPNTSDETAPFALLALLGLTSIATITVTVKKVRSK